MSVLITAYFRGRRAGLKPADAWECALLKARYEADGLAGLAEAMKRELLGN